jgi:antitoxin MazE
MKTRLIQIGKAKGLRIPAALLKKSRLTDEVQVDATEGQITIRSKKNPREGWDRDFKRMAANSDDQLFRDDPVLLSKWDESEWQW